MSGVHLVVWHIRIQGSKLLIFLSGDDGIHKETAGIALNLRIRQFGIADIDDHFTQLLGSRLLYASPLQFLTGLRIERAKDMLRVRATSGLTVEAVARSAGFRSNYYFSRVFKKCTGLSPREWEARTRRKETE